MKAHVPTMEPAVGVGLMFELPSGTFPLVPVQWTWFLFKGVDLLSIYIFLVPKGTSTSFLAKLQVFKIFLSPPVSAPHSHSKPG